ncbi:MAG: SPFH domain / Band 7 family protein [bacterium ADurb.Bin374]|nr:MAG: SPFH domain / Band 7 family protein [bacterium ADurb.Bin374]
MEILAETIGVVDGAALFSRLGEQFAACVGETVRRAADAHDGGELDAVEQVEIIRSVVADKAGKFGRAVVTGAAGRRPFGAETVDLGGDFGKADAVALGERCHAGDGAVQITKVRCPEGLGADGKVEETLARLPTEGHGLADLCGTALQLEMYIWFYIFRALGQARQSETPKSDACEEILAEPAAPDIEPEIAVGAADQLELAFHLAIGAERQIPLLFDGPQQHRLFVGTEIIRSGLLAEYAEIIDLKDNERALLWIDGRFQHLLPPGRYAVWKRMREVRVERVTVDDPQFRHRLLMKITQTPGSDAVLRTIQVEQEQTCLYFRDGAFVGELGPGLHAFWKDAGVVKLHCVDRREKVLDMSGQEIITRDKVTLRLNAIVSYRITDSRRAFEVSEVPDQALYRECQLILRTAIGGRNLDDMLSDKDTLAGEIVGQIRAKGEAFGLAVIQFGIKDLILPGDIRELMNRVVAAQKEAEANQIVRREETAATRSQCNTAKMLEQNPVLMRLRELEVLERVAKDSKLNLILGEKGLTEKVVNLL